MALSELLTPAGVAARTGQHPKTVLKAFRRGDLPGIKLGASTVRFHPADVERYIDSHRVKAAT